MRQDLDSHWRRWLNPGRRRPGSGRSGPHDQPRTPIERDYDRVLFSTPVRRMADKTQVFPLDRSDSVRTRLTHSHEVANLARSVGIDLVFNQGIAEGLPEAKRDVPALLATIGLAHDLGNPPFGHQGEDAIARWFEINRDEVLDDDPALSPAMKQDFLRFEGNAQTLRLLTKLQLINDDYGLNLTLASLAALVKYPVASDQIDPARVTHKKHGYFQSERALMDEVWEGTGLAPGQRHPLTWVMEACDDIAYSVLDAEDAVKKGLLSFSDTIAFLRHEAPNDPVVTQVCDAAAEEHKAYRRERLSPDELNDISMQTFRIRAIGALMEAIGEVFIESMPAMAEDGFGRELVDASRGGPLLAALKACNWQHAYRHKSVLRVELTGLTVIHGLMDAFWYAITRREERNEPASTRSTPLAGYIYQRISENYRRVFESPGNPMPIRYREAQLLTDMISGMTDSFAVSLYEEFCEVGFRPTTQA
ncbi:dNTP triphosphohydrolase [Guyparkeria hydrothermalis]|uniref:dGTP triphosphohydrolase n=1 Tax=Guyparkeria hydrothermalis TaxID=923 RepID=UPI00202067A9|nr:dNTP triphosphohydrolase [Guyparkeria hydrothermalis]MCL7744977.1 dNTP triphosphohydrolase [Guyparkeria hydrothermalis]